MNNEEMKKIIDLMNSAGYNVSYIEKYENMWNCPDNSIKVENGFEIRIIKETI